MARNARGKPRTAAHAHPRRAKLEAPADVAFTRAAALFRAAGDVSRLRLLHALGQTEWCVSELAAESGTKLSTLSQQLRVLYSERIVERRREGKHIYYRLVDQHVRDLVRAALEHAAEEA
ncbi:MAG: metalloregulator ArsR/SmtB family transcription factor [Myxococcota bacterium]|nr:metalloregulator ArsR/SmtB family transcription factor [Myxococcota bacterium]